MNCARNCENLLNFVKVIPKTLLVPFFSGHGVGIRMLYVKFHYNRTVTTKDTEIVKFVNVIET